VEWGLLYLGREVVWLWRGDAAAPEPAPGGTLRIKRRTQ
jgi:hypothetical protein